MLDGLKGNLQLSQHHARFLYHPSIVVNIFRRDHCVRTWGYDNGVIAVGSDGYHGNSRWTCAGPHGADIDSASHQLRSQFLTKRVGADAGDHANRIAEPCHGDRLIRALPTWVHLKVATVNGLSYKWDSLRPGDQVDVDAPNHDNRFTLHGHGEPPSLSNRGAKRCLPTDDIQSPADACPHLSFPGPFPLRSVPLVLSHAQAIHHRHPPRQLAGG